jgi:hypothetical protein
VCLLEPQPAAPGDQCIVSRPALERGARTLQPHLSGVVRFGIMEQAPRGIEVGRRCAEKAPNAVERVSRASVSNCAQVSLDQIQVALRGFEGSATNLD